MIAGTFVPRVLLPRLSIQLVSPEPIQIAFVEAKDPDRPHTEPTIVRGFELKRINHDF